MRTTAALVLATVGLSSAAQAAKLIEVRTLDDEHLMIVIQDSEVFYNDTGTGPGAFGGHESQGGDRIEYYNPPLNVSAAASPASFRIVSKDDPTFALPTAPLAVYRKSKLSGTSWKWPDPDVSIEHALFVQLPRKMRPGSNYTLTLDASLGSDVPSRTVAFDLDRSMTEAIHVNLLGYHPDMRTKSADLYLWRGDGGARDYSAYNGNKVWLVEDRTNRRHPVGQVKFWKTNGPDVGKWDYTKSPVWTCDFGNFRRPGTYRLVVDGVGCSRPFRIAKDVYHEPFRTSVRGFYYMRIGEPRDMKPTPRQPRFIPNVDPPTFKVIRTTFGPWHEDWTKTGRDTWDVIDWSKYAEPGNPTNPNAYGGHSDAADWDRHAGHISIIWDMLLPYLLSNGKIGEDNLGIRESGNGIPDIIDEAQNEVDFWLRLRDGNGNYAFGLNNPSQNNTVMYQAGARPYMAWANAANAAMLADAYRVAKKPALMAKYRDAAVEAWNRAGGEDLDYRHSIGNGSTRGRDLKATAAASLYNVTGERKYEDAFALECVVKDEKTPLDGDGYNQQWAAASYLLAEKRRLRPIHYPALAKRLKAALWNEAKTKNLDTWPQRPSRRTTDEAYAWFQSIQENQRLAILHAIVDDAARKEQLLQAMLLEADWGLGRNPMNMVQMTGLGQRHAEDIYTSGRNDGFPGVHPGHTPYMNSEPWGEGFMADPKWNARRGYPEWERWPHGEALWPARYCYSNNEFTPQQSMKGKMVLLGYLYSLGERPRR